MNQAASAPIHVTHDEVLSSLAGKLGQAMLDVAAQEVLIEKLRTRVSELETQNVEMLKQLETQE